MVASTGKPHEADYLRQLGAAEVIDRASLAQPGKPLQAERWAAAVDTAGSHTLVNVCASTKYDGIVAACGLAQGMDFPATVAPFILRGVTLAGINSVLTPAGAACRLDDDRAPGRAREAAPPLEGDRSRGGDCRRPTVLAGAVTGRLVVNVAT